MKDILRRQNHRPEDFSEHVPGELIVKLKEGHSLVELEGLRQQYRIFSVEPVFPPMASPEEKLTGLKKQRAALETPDHSGWYWWRDKESKEFKDYEARIAQEKAGLDRAIEAKEQLIGRLQARQKRAPEGITAPSLEGIHLLKAADDADIASLVKGFRSHPAVQYAEPNYKMKVNTLPNDTYVDPDGDGVWETAPWIPAASPVTYEALWGARKIEADRAWDLFAQGDQPGFELAGQGVIVAVIDTGINYTHPDLAANMWTGLGYDFVNNDEDPMDDNGHGSHCAGTIGAVGGNGIGISGIAPRVQLMAVKGLDAGGSGGSDNLARCVRYATANGADILSNSWGGGGRSQLFEEVFADAQSDGVICIAAAGNSNASATGFTPANVPGVITVAASDSHDQKASFSNWGEKVDLSAPGGGVASELGGDASDLRNILSTLPEGVTIATRRPELQVGEGYYRLAGTSMACPHVSGVAALVLARRPETGPSEMRTRLRATADPYPVLPAVPLGTGRVNAYRAVETEPFPFVHVLGLEQAEGSGNGDGIVEAGEELLIFIQVKNFWASASTGSVTIRLPEGTPLSVISGSVELGPLGRGEQRRNSDRPLVLKVRDDFRFTGDYPVLFDLLAEGHLRTVSGSVRLGVLVLPLEEGAAPSLAQLSGHKLVYQDDRRLRDYNYDLYEYDLNRKAERLLLPYPGTPGVEYVDIERLASQDPIVILDRLHLPEDEDPEDTQRTLTLFNSNTGRKKILSRLRQPSDLNYSPLDFPYRPVLRDGRLVAVDYGTVRGQIVNKGLAVWNVSDQGQTTRFLKEDFDGREAYSFDLSGDRLVAAAVNYPSSRTDILLYDMTTRQFQTIASDPRPSAIVTGLSVDGDFVAWGTLVLRAFITIHISFEISVHDLRSGVTRVLAQMDDLSFFFIGSCSPPLVRDGWVVWVDSRADPRRESSDVYLYDLSTEQEIRLTSTPRGEYLPRISDGLIYWQEGIHPSRICLAKLPASRPPVLEPLPPQFTIHEGQALSFTLFASDPDGGRIRFSADSLPSGASLDPETGAFSWTPDYTQAGSQSILFRASDGRQADTQSVLILVQNVPQPPVLTPIGNKSVNENAMPPLSFAISATDPDGDRLVYSVSGLPSGAKFNAVKKEFSWKPTYDQAGVYEVTFTAKDPGNLFDSETIQITVNNVNRPPVLNKIGFKTVRAGRTLTFTVNGSDPDGDPLTFSASGLPAGAQFDPQTRQFTWTPTAWQGGVYSVVFQVSDGVRTVSERVPIVVSG